MSMVTKGPTIHDFLLAEGQNNYSRDEMTIAASQIALRPGDVLQPDASDNLVAWGFGVDAVQTVICASATAGTFTLTLMDSTGVEVTTGDIDWDGNIAAIDAAIEAALTGATSVVTAGLDAGAADTIVEGFSVTFGGTGYTGLSQPLVKVNVGGLTYTALPIVTGLNLANAVHTLTGSIAAGAIRLGFTDPVTGEYELTALIAHDANTAAVQTELDALTICANGDIVFSEATIDSPGIFTYSANNWAGIRVAIPHVVPDDTASDVVINITETIRGGTASGGAPVAGICLADVPVLAATQTASVLVRDAVVNTDALRYMTGDKATAIAQLKLLKIVSRTQATETSQQTT